MQPNQAPNYWRPGDEDNAALQEQPLPPVAEQPESEPVEEPDALISWQASEYVHYEKQTLWFVGLVGISLLLLGFSIFVISSWSFTILIVVMAVAISYMAMRSPRVVEYELGPHGIRINDKHFNYHDFRAFGILNEGPLYSVQLVPNKRFSPTVNMYFPAELGERIVDLLGSLLPMEEIEPHPIDKLTRKLRF